MPQRVRISVVLQSPNLAPSGNPPTSKLDNTHGINAILEHRAFRTRNSTYMRGFAVKTTPNKVFIMNKIELVEAAGVEPASEIAVSQENPCSVRFRMFSPHALRTDKMRIKLVR